MTSKGTNIMKSKLLVVGNCYMETVLWVDAIPSADTLVSENNSFTNRPGGRGGCAAIAASRMGLDVSICASLGKDANGTKLVGYYNENGIDTAYVSTDRRPTGISLHIHENSFDTDRKILCSGANVALHTDQVSRAMESTFDAVFLSTDINPELLCDATHTARINGLPVYLDAVGVKSSLPLAKLENLELFITDIAGVRSITGITINNADRCLTAAMALSGRVFAKYYVIKLGTLGTFIYDGKFQQHVIPCSLDTKSIGAPIDTEAAVIAASYLATGNLKNSCALAAVMAKMSREDPKIKIPSLSQAVDYCRFNNIRFK